MRTETLRLLGTVALFGVVACTSTSESRDPAATSADSAATLAAFQVTGSPEAATGATWTFRATTGNTTYDLQGILLKPQGSGPFPAVIVSHGAGGNASGYSRAAAQIMARWGLVVIATNYTHAGGVPVGSPGTANEPGASAANLQRARKLLDILRALGYVDMRRVAAHGHSMGAFVTTGLLSAEPTAFLVASHTAGGVRPDAVSGAAPTESQAMNVVTPYQMHHGDADVVVALSSDQRLATILSQRGTMHELFVYPGASHADVSLSTAVFDRVRQWYVDRGLLK